MNWIVMKGADYARAWGSRDASVYGVTLSSGVSPPQGAAELL